MSDDHLCNSAIYGGVSELLVAGFSPETALQKQFLCASVSPTFKASSYPFMCNIYLRTPHILEKMKYFCDAPPGSEYIYALYRLRTR